VKCANIKETKVLRDMDRSEKGGKIRAHISLKGVWRGGPGKNLESVRRLNTLEIGKGCNILPDL